MDITKDQRLAFLTICRVGSISRAAVELNITQAALSIRLQRLEDILSSSLLVRSRNGVTPTAAGLRFLEYATTLDQFEKNWWRQYREVEEGLHGELRIGTFSTIGRSLVLPALQPLISKNPNLHFHSFIKELRELPQLLASGECDFIFLDRPLHKDRVESVLLGHEEYVYIKSKTHDSNLTTFLNHDEADDMSFRWFKEVGRKNTIEKRRYFDEIYSVIDGVAMGMGVSVLPEHLVQDDKRIQIMHKSQKLKSPVYLVYQKRSYYPEHIQKAKELLIKEMTKSLK